MIALALALAAVQAPPAAVGGPWRYRETIDPITDARVPSARTGAIVGEGQFVFACNGPDRLLSFQFLTRRYLGGRDESEVILRIDDGAPIIDSWERRSGGTFIAQPRRVVEIAQDLADGRRLAVRAFDFEDQPIDAIFNIEGARATINSVLAACDLPTLGAGHDSAPSTPAPEKRP